MPTRRAVSAAIAASLLGSLPRLPAGAARAQEATPAACAPVAPDANRQVALDWLAAISDHDLGRFDALMTPGSIYHAATVADATGPAAARDIYQVVIDGFPDIVYTPRETIASGDYAAVRYIAEGTNTGAFRGAPPSGNRAAWQGLAIMRMECGRIAETWMEVDQLARAAAIGTARDTPLVQAMLGGPQRGGASPAEPAAPAADCPPATRREAEQVYFVWDEVWDTGDIALLDGMFTDAAAASDANADGVSLHDELAAAVAAWKGAMPDLQDQTDLIFAEGDLVAARWTANGTMTGDFLGVPATGKPVAYTGITMLRLECGRIAEAWTEIDAASMLDAMEADWRA